MPSKANKKHRNLTAATSFVAGFCAPSTKKSKATKYPHLQVFIPKDKAQARVGK